MSEWIPIPNEAEFNYFNQFDGEVTDAEIWEYMPRLYAPNIPMIEIYPGQICIPIVPIHNPDGSVRTWIPVSTRDVSQQD